jgi:hypothetical protein
VLVAEWAVGGAHWAVLAACLAVHACPDLAASCGMAFVRFSHSICCLLVKLTSFEFDC